MAKINVEFDTKDKVLSVTMDGQVIEDVSSVEFYKGYDNPDQFHGVFTTVERMDDDKVIKVTRVSAKDGITETTESSNLPKLLARKLFPKKVI